MYHCVLEGFSVELPVRERLALFWPFNLYVCFPLKPQTALLLLEPRSLVALLPSYLSTLSSSADLPWALEILSWFQRFIPAWFSVTFQPPFPILSPSQALCVILFYYDTNFLKVWSSKYLPSFAFKDSVLCSIRMDSLPQFPQSANSAYWIRKRSYCGTAVHWEQWVWLSSSPLHCTTGLLYHLLLT